MFSFPFVPCACRSFWMTQAKNQDQRFLSWHLLFYQARTRPLFASKQRPFCIVFSCQFHGSNRWTDQDMEHYFFTSPAANDKARVSARQVTKQAFTYLRKTARQWNLTSAEIDSLLVLINRRTPQRGQPRLFTREFFGNSPTHHGRENVFCTRAYRVRKRFAASWCFFDDPTHYTAVIRVFLEGSWLFALWSVAITKVLNFALKKAYSTSIRCTQGEHKMRHAALSPSFSHRHSFTLPIEGFRDANW